MIQIVCANCRKTLSIDETKLPMKAVQIPCPVCKTSKTVDRSKLVEQAPAESSDSRYRNSPRSEWRETASVSAQPAPTAKTGGNGRESAERASVIATECTSCKATLEIEQASLSPREPTVLKCPSCGTTLTVDKRKLQASLGGGPVVRVASESYKPLPPVPSPEDVNAAGETGDYVLLVGALYAGAEHYLEEVIEVNARAAALRDAQRRGSAALDAIAVPAAKPTDHYAREVVAEPELRTVDGALMTESWYLHNVRGLTETALRLHPLLRAPQRYAPAVEWQKATYGTLVEVYETAATRSPRLASRLERLRQSEKAYVEVCACHQRDRNDLEARIASRVSQMTSLTAQITLAEKEVTSLERQASAEGKKTLLEGGGCGAAIAAAILAAIAGGASNSGSFGFTVFVLLVFAGLYVVHQTGYGKNASARSRASEHVTTLRNDADETEEQSTYLRKLLVEHLAIAPDAIAKTIPIAAWSPISTADFDEHRPSLVVPAAAPQHIPVSSGTSVADVAGT